MEFLADLIRRLFGRGQDIVVPEYEDDEAPAPADLKEGMEMPTRRRRLSRYYEDYRKISPDLWRWPSFEPWEIACKGSGTIKLDFDALNRLQALRDYVGVPVNLNSAYRSPAHNQRVGGARQSQHLEGKAFDIRITDVLTRQVIHEAAGRAGFTGIGDYDTFVHVDTGPKRYWDERG